MAYRPWTVVGTVDGTQRVISRHQMLDEAAEFVAAAAAGGGAPPDYYDEVFIVAPTGLPYHYDGNIGLWYPDGQLP